MNKKILYTILLITILFLIIGTKIISIKNNDEIITYELKTSEYFEKIQSTNKYRIESIEELDNFYSLYSNKLSRATSKINIDNQYLKNNTIFIMVEQKSTGSIKLKLSSVTFENNKINFNIERNSPQTVTEDMAFWYLVAGIPKSKLKNIDINDWKKPSEILNNNLK